jgi:hypothetical protein
MANTGDILAPKLLADGTFEETVLTPASIGAASLINGTVPASQLPPISYQSITHLGDGLTSAYAPPGTLTASDSPSAISVTINGVTQEPNADYTIDIATNRVVLSDPLPLGDKIVITRPILLPSNSALTAEQLGAATTQALSAESQARAAADADLQDALADESAARIAALDTKAPLLWDYSELTYTENSPDNIAIPASRRRRYAINSFTVKQTGIALTLPRRTTDGALDGDQLEISLGGNVNATIFLRRYIFTGSSYIESTEPLETLNFINGSPRSTHLFRLNGFVWNRVPVTAHTHPFSDLSGVQPLLTPQGTVTPSNTAIISLTANRAIFFTKTQPGDFQLQLPQTATAGDRIVVVRNAGTNDGLLHIQRFNSGGWQTLSTLTANGQRASFYRDSTNWSLESAPPHTHAVEDITGAASTSALATETLARTQADAALQTATQAALDGKAASGLDQSGQVQQALELTDLGTELPTLRLSNDQVFVAESYRANFRAAIGAASETGLDGTNAEFDLRVTGLENRLDTIEEVDLPALGQRIDGKADSDHGHDISQITIGDPPGFLEDLGAAHSVHTHTLADITDAGNPNGVATLDSTGKLPATQLPDLAISDFLGNVADQAAMLTKTGQKGDWVTRADDGKVYVITGDTPSQAASWTALSYPAAPVSSVAGKTGAVTLAKADVGLGNVANTAPADLPISTATQTALDGKSNLYPNDPEQGAAAKAVELWDTSQNASALRIRDTAVFLQEVETDAGDLKASFREAIGAASTSALADKLGLSASSYIIAQPGDNFATKYAQAKTLTPNGGPKSATNRASLILFPGTYPLSSELAIDAEFVDLVGLGAQFQSPAVIVSNNTLNVTANDVRVSGISVGTQAFKIGNNKPLQVFENCTGGNNSFGYSSEASGTFVGCAGGDESFGSASNASGVFLNCNALNSSFGALGDATGLFKNCVAGEYGFGGDGGTLSGELLFCRLTTPTSSYVTPSGSGIIRFCLDGDNNIVNADAP